MSDAQQRIVTEGRQTDAEIFAATSDYLLDYAASPPPSPNVADAGLFSAIELEIIPRLVMGRDRRPPEDARSVGLEGVDLPVFTNLVLSTDPDAATAFAFGLFARGVSAEDLFLNLLAPAARHLGDLWLADRLSFAHVTLGTWRLQCLLHDLTPAFQRTAGRVDVNRNILLLNLPSEQHTFGVTMLAEFFRRARWNVTVLNPLPAVGDATDMVRTERFDIVGVSLNSQERLNDCIRLVRAVRRSSGNRAVGVMVGGPTFIEHPEFIARVGADAVALDGKQAPLEAERLASAVARLAC